MKEFVTVGYEVNELSSEAVERAHDDWLNAGASDFDSQYVIEDMTECAKELGITVDNIYYSGFSSQGDGACFVGHYEFDPTWNAKAQDGFPRYSEMFELGNRLQKAHEKYGELYATVYKTNYRYDHENTVTVDVESLSEDEDFPILDAQEMVEDILKDFMHEIYRRLEQEYTWSTSIEYFHELAEANEWYFTEEGKLL